MFVADPARDGCSLEGDGPILPTNDARTYAFTAAGASLYAVPSADAAATAEVIHAALTTAGCVADVADTNSH